MKKMFRYFFIISIAIVTLSCKTAPKEIPLKTKIGDCTSCHDQEKILPDNHMDTRVIDW